MPKPLARGVQAGIADLIKDAANAPVSSRNQTPKGFRRVAEELGVSYTQLRRIRHGQAELPASAVRPLAAMTGLSRSVVLYVAHKEILGQAESAELAKVLGDTYLAKPSPATVEASAEMPHDCRAVTQAITNVCIPSYATFRQSVYAARMQLVEGHSQVVALSKPAMLERDTLPYLCNQPDLATAPPPAKQVPMGSTLAIRLMKTEEAKNGDLVLVQFGETNAMLLWYASRTDAEGNVQETYSTSDPNGRLRVVLYRKDLPEKTLQSQRLLIGTAVRVIHYPLDTLY